MRVDQWAYAVFRWQHVFPRMASQRAFRIHFALSRRDPVLDKKQSRNGWQTLDKEVVHWKNLLVDLEVEQDQTMWPLRAKIERSGREHALAHLISLRGCVV